MRSMIHSFSVAFVLAAFAIDASAQQVTLRGKVEDAPAGGFLVDCTDTLLTSSAVNLSSFKGQQVELSGTWNGSSDAPSVDVTAMNAVAELFEVGGSGKIGEELHLKVTSAPGDVAVMFVALDSGFLPAHHLGVLLLGLTPLLHVATGTVNGVGEFEVKGNVPNDPALDGLVIYGQSLVIFTAGGSVFSNPDCETIHT